MSNIEKELREMILNVKTTSGGMYGGYLTEESVAVILALFKKWALENVVISRFELKIFRKELFMYANSLSGDITGNIAVKLHMFCNDLLDIIEPKEVNNDKKE